MFESRFARWLRGRMRDEDLNMSGLAVKLGLAHTSVRRVGGGYVVECADGADTVRLSSPEAYDELLRRRDDTLSC